MNGSNYAFIGDAILTLLTREYLISKSVSKANQLQRQTAKFVSAMMQAEIAKQWMENTLLSEDEIIIFKRGVNYKNRSMAKNADIRSYKLSTGIEALFGYWYLEKKQERLGEMWEKYKTIVEKKYD